MQFLVSTLKPMVFFPSRPIIQQRSKQLQSVLYLKLYDVLLRLRYVVLIFKMANK